jgi:hypothetical protein
MISIGTQCYVLDSCRASARTQCAVGRVVQVVSAPYDAPDWTYLPGTYYDVAFDGSIFYCHASKLAPLSDPAIDVGDDLVEPVADPADGPPTERLAPPALKP